MPKTTAVDLRVTQVRVTMAELPAPVESAKEAGLHYVSDTMAGIRRTRQGDTFQYLAPNGSQIHDEATLNRIKSLVIPPAWTDVWICPSPKGHLQATGRDAKGRKQYRYHARWRHVRDESKYEHMLAFAEALPTLRARIEADLNRPGMPREKVLATVVRLLERTHIRIGNEAYARENQSYGLTTLRDEHVAIHGSRLRFQFRGKSGKDHEITLDDPRLAKIVKRSRDIPGHDLFQYIDEHGDHHAVTSTDVNAYLKAITDADFTAKDFRTWAGTILAACAFCDFEPVTTQKDAKANVVQAIKQVSQHLGNTPTVCRKCYVHPAVIEAYLAGNLTPAVRDRYMDLAAQRRDEIHFAEALLLDLMR